MLFKKFYTELILGLKENLVGLLNRLNLNTLTFEIIDH